MCEEKETRTEPERMSIIFKYPHSMLEGKRDLFKDELVQDDRDAKTPDNWVARHPEMVRLTGLHPFNAESPAKKLMQAGFITPSAIHYTRNHGAVPQLAWETHRVQILGDDEMVAAGLLQCSLSMSDILSLPSVSLPVTLTCAGNRRKEENLTKRTVGFSWNTTATSTAVWTGVRLRDVLAKLAGLSWPPGEDIEDPHDLFVWMQGADELPKGKYGTCLPLGHVMNEANDVILAYKVNGELLPPDRGYPIRVIVPGWIGGRMVKWLERLEIRRGESTSYYHYFDNRILPSHVTKELADEEDWWTRPDYLFNELNINSAIMSPFHGDSITLSELAKPDEIIPISGYAYTGGGRRITRVEISFNYGQDWHLCSLSKMEKPNAYGRHWCWVFWTFEATSSMVAGRHRMIHCRAWDDANNTQPDRLAWNVMGMGNNHCFGVRVDHSQTENGEVKLSFVHPTQEAGMSTVGWMSQDHEPLPPSPPMYGLLGYEDDETESTGFEEDHSLSSDSDPHDPDFLALPVYSLEQVASHDSEESAWIIVNSCVYDCTRFLAQHPGGSSSIVMNAGGDCTEDFVGIHSSKATDMLQDYLIGRIQTEKPSTSKSTNNKSSKALLAPLLEEESGPWLKKKTWIPFQLVDRESLSDDAVLLRFRPEQAKDSLLSRPLGLPVGMHVMVKAVKSNGQTVIRAYTPIMLDGKHEGKDEFSLVVKVYRPCEKFPEGGLLSQHLADMSLKDIVQVKGPCGHIEYAGAGVLRVAGKEVTCSDIGFICGGSGITPAFRVITAALKDASCNSVFWLLYANRRIEDILLHNEIKQLVALHPERFKVYYTLSDPPVDEDWAFGEGFVNEEMIRNHIPKPSSTTFVGLCGPPPMIKFACIPNLEKLGFSAESFDCF